MRVIEEFSSHLDLPIHVDSVADYIKKCGYVDEIVFVTSDDDGEAIGGMLYHVEYIVAYGTRDAAYIVHNKNLPFNEARLICAKELIHIADSPQAAANSAAAVDQLTQEMVIPAEALRDMASLGIKTVSDRAGFLRGLAVLFPMSARNVLMPAFTAGKITIQQIASIALLPEGYVAVVMSPIWDSIYESIMKTADSFCSPPPNSACSLAKATGN